NIKTIKDTGAKTVVFSCAEGFRTFDIDYQDFYGDLGFEVKHISEYLLDLVEQGKLELGGSASKVTYHDSCRLGRHMGIYDEPRDLIKATGAELIEMRSIKEKAICCGVNAFVNCGEVAKKMQVERLLEARGTGTDTMQTICPKCLIHYNCVLSADKRPEELADIKVRVRDASVFLAESLKGAKKE
ncbi:MAG: (Fe-S)-binding protein, partial [Methanomassiliicoccales archaeon]|nr:(Fe-S)-binding protein [Methanomassiliicoccales archaeon]